MVHLHVHWTHSPSPLPYSGSPSVRHAGYVDAAGKVYAQEKGLGGCSLHVVHTSCRMCETHGLRRKKRCRTAGYSWLTTLKALRHLVSAPIFLLQGKGIISMYLADSSQQTGNPQLSGKWKVDLKDWKKPNRNTDTHMQNQTTPPQTNKQKPRKTVLQFTKTLNIIAPLLQCRCGEWRNLTQLHLFVPRRKLLLWVRRNRTWS